MNRLEIVKNKLIRLGYINVIIKSSTIEFSDSKTKNYEIFNIDIDIKQNKIGWFQTSDDNEFKIIIIENDEIFEWIAITSNPIFGCLSLLVEWIEDYLVFIYQEKHEIYICSIKNKVVDYFKFHGTEIERKNNLVSYETYINQYSKKGLVRLLQIPELIEVKPISIEKAKQEKLIPKGLNRPDGFLNRNYS